MGDVCAVVVGVDEGIGLLNLLDLMNFGLVNKSLMGLLFPEDEYLRLPCK